MTNLRAVIRDYTDRTNYLQMLALLGVRSMRAVFCSIPLGEYMPDPARSVFWPER